ncbi:MAG: CAP domain-containing protein [Patescibacteria group bacterium]|nr:CAP domain-containing protein [Patescibacteria group bacterium]
MKDFLHHLFLPHISNNYRPKLLHHKSILLTIAILFFAGFSFSAVRTTFPSVLGTFSDISSEQLLLLTNQKRQENGLAPLSLNQQLSAAALNKANDMFAQNYWAHNSPDGKTPWVFIKGAGYNYIYAGENLARGFNNAQDLINAWMASESHRKNMLSGNYQNVGFAVETGKLNGEDTVLVVEFLGSTALAAVPASTNQLASKIQQEVTSITSSPIPASNTPVPTPTSTPANIVQKVVPSSSLGNKAGGLVLEANKTPNPKPLINSATLSSNVSKGVVALFIFALILDMLVIERRRVVRLVGHNMDHVFFLTLTLLLITFIVKGAIN